MPNESENCEKEDVWRKIAEHKDRLRAVAFSLCHNPSDVDDLVSRTLERACAKFGTFEERGGLFYWMRQIMVNIAADDARDRGLYMTHASAPASFPDGSDGAAEDEALATNETDDTILRDSDGEVVRAAIERLSPEYRKTVVMHYLMDMPLKEIAKVLGRPIGTVKWRLSVAKSLLAGMLKRSFGRSGTWVALALGLFVGCVATVVVMRLPSRSPDEQPFGGMSFNTPRVHEIAVRHAPKSVVVDGDLREWAAPVFEAACNPPYDRDYKASMRMMWDEDRLYVAGDVRTPDPMRNNTSVAGGYPFPGGSVICRLAANADSGNDFVSLVLYYDNASGSESIYAHTLKKGGMGRINLLRSAWSGAYRRHHDGRGYTFEYAVEWRAVGIVPPKAGETRVNTWNIHFSDADGIACTGQIVENTAAIIPEKNKDRSLISYCFFPPTWGKAVFEL